MKPKNNSKKEKIIPKYKINLVKNLDDLIKNKKTILIASIKNIPASQFQEIGKKLRGKAIIKVPKKNLLTRAIDELKNEQLKDLKNQIENKENVAILFSDLDSYELAAELTNIRSPSKAKAGQEAPEDIEVEEGPTELVPGPAISELGALGIQIEIKEGKINIKKSKVIVPKGKKISQNAADIMSKLGIKPFSIGFIPLLSYDTKENKLYLDIKINKEEATKELEQAHSKAIGFAVNLAYISKDTISLLLQKAAGQEKRLHRIITGEPEEIVENAETPKTESQESNKKEESKLDNAAGLAGLFG